MDAHFEKINANYEDMRAIIDAYYEKRMAKMNAHFEEMIKAITEACQEEKKESTPEDTEAVAESEEVPEGATDAEAIGAAKGRSRDLRLALGYRGRLKTRIKRDGRVRQEHAATVGRPTRRFVPAMRKGHVRRGPGKRCRRNGVREPGETSDSRMGGRSLKQRETQDNALRETPEGRTYKKRRRTRPECNSSVRRLSKTPGNGRGGRAEKRRLERMEADREIIRRSLRLDIAKLMIMSFIGLREPGDGLLWKCRPPSKRKR
jgi:hypothetical protein